MGFLACLEPQQHQALPHTPPDLVNLGCSASVSASLKLGPSGPSSKDVAWLHPAPPISPPMFSHDRVPPPPQSSVGPITTSAPMASPTSIAATTASAARGSPSEPSREAPRTLGGDLPRQQLPSLSSLFGPPESAQARSQAAVPVDVPRRQQSPPSPYFSKSISPSIKSRTSPLLSQQPRYVYESARSVDHRSSQATYTQPQQQLPPSSHQISPRSHEKPLPDARSAYSKWSWQEEGGSPYQAQERLQPQQPTQSYRQSQYDNRPQSYQQPSMAEKRGYSAMYSSGDRSPVSDYQQKPPYHSQPPPAPPLPQPSPRSPFGGSCSSAPGEFHGSSARSVSASGPPAPATTTTAYVDGVPVKDGLGPKIWTGTHFLPRFVRASEVPGEGMCYFYDDGSHCKTVIDGEAVNAHWGVTKAGKPRKRLAIACVTCREKKIKCDPDYPRCVQCEKLGRVCKFKNAPRGGNNISPGTPAAEPDTRRLAGSMSSIESSRPYGYPSGLDSPVSSASKRVRMSLDSYSPAHTRSPPPGINRSLPPPPSRSEPLITTSLLPPLAWTGTPQPRSPPSVSLSGYPPQHQSQQSFSLPPHSHHSRPRSPHSPRTELPRIFLPPPRSYPDVARKHDEVLIRPWQQELRPHGRV